MAAHYKYRSKLEECIAEELEDAKVKFTYETEKLPYKVKLRGAKCGDCGSKDCYQERNYIPDFIITTASKGKVYLEAKGRFTSRDRTKMASVCEGRTDVWMLFPSNNKLNKNSEVRYSDWCGYKDIKCSVGKSGGHFLPAEWLEEWRRR